MFGEDKSVLGHGKDVIVDKLSKGEIFDSKIEQYWDRETNTRIVARPEHKNKPNMLQDLGFGLVLILGFFSFFRAGRFRRVERTVLAKQRTEIQLVEYENRRRI